MSETPALRTALEERQAAEAALARHVEWTKERYGHRGVPASAPERIESDRLERLTWEKLENVQTAQAQQRDDRINNVLDAVDTLDRRLVQRWSRKTDQERWDDQTELNRARAESQTRIARVADRVGLRTVADKAREETRIHSWMAERAENCPNNPRNGGDGYSRWNNEWTDRRGPDWRYVEDRETALGAEPGKQPRDTELVRDDPAAVGREAPDRAELERGA